MTSDRYKKLRSANMAVFNHNNAITVDHIIGKYFNPNKSFLGHHYVKPPFSDWRIHRNGKLEHYTTVGLCDCDWCDSTWESFNEYIHERLAYLNRVEQRNDVASMEWPDA